MKTQLYLITLVLTLWATVVWGQQITQGSSTSVSLSESYLLEVANAHTATSGTRASIAMIGGVAVVAYGIHLSSARDDYWGFNQAMGEMIITTGLTTALSGLIYYNRSRSVEKKWLGVASIVDPSERERAAHTALKELSRSALSLRIVNSMIYTGLGIYFLASEEDMQLVGTIPLGAAAMSLLMNSAEEKKWSQYLKERRSAAASLSLDVGLVPSGGGVLRAKLSF